MELSPSLNVKVTESRQSYLYNILPNMQIMPSIYLNCSTCIYFSLDNGVTMTSKRRENKKSSQFHMFFFFPSYKFF